MPNLVEVRSLMPADAKAVAKCVNWACYRIRHLRRRLPDLHPRVAALEKALKASADREKLQQQLGQKLQAEARELEAAKAASQRAEQQTQELAATLCREQQRSKKLKDENLDHEQRFSRQAHSIKEAQARLVAVEREFAEFRQRSQEKLEAEKMKALDANKEHQRGKGEGRASERAPGAEQVAQSADHPA